MSPPSPSTGEKARSRRPLVSGSGSPPSEAASARMHSNERAAGALGHRTRILAGGRSIRARALAVGLMFASKVAGYDDVDRHLLPSFATPRRPSNNARLAPGALGSLAQTTFANERAEDAQ